MSFDWNKYFLLAEDIYKNTKKASGDNEATQRTAISRAYYSVFHLSEDNAISNMAYQRPTKNHHSEIILFYKKQMADPNHQELGKLLSTLRFSREKCDYEAGDFGDIKKLLESSILHAKTIKSLL
mgnify:CR=1 FL=1